MAELKSEVELPRIGIVATGEVRIEGLAAVLAGLGELSLVLMSEPDSFGTAGLDLVLVDATTTPHFVELLASFR